MLRSNSFRQKRALCQLRSFSSLLKSHAYINGKWVEAGNKDMFNVINPANGNVVGIVPNMDVNDAVRAVSAAKKALNNSEWHSFTAKDRSDLLKKWFYLIKQNADEISSIMTTESGKPISEARGEVTYGNAFLEWFAEQARRIYGEVIPSPIKNREIVVLKQPLGVAALITPWNFPLAMITRKTGAALAAGCTIVMKPAEDTPLTALALVKLAEEAGFPDGVVNIITTNKAAPIGDYFCKSLDVNGISFTGSTEVGKLLFRNSSGGIKRISLELGGNAPFIVFKSANLENAVEAAVSCKFRNCGQTCISANRFFLQHEIHDEFIELFKQRVAALKVGDGSKPGVQIGPLINTTQFNKVCTYVEDARLKCAKVILGGKALNELGELFYSPTIITNVPSSAKLYTEEIFGPVASIIKFKTEPEVIKAANDTRRGLAGYFFSEDIQQVFRVAKLLELGMVGVNEGLISAAEAPFGGVKESGIGREGCHHGIDEYVEVKYICFGNLKY
ncbi:glutarate-semialdehyde dehydrogenase [Eurosta solidaginis]|uniref:glutarate-semialdehyde dehydrogenase n=1 Tax=Eurosta solidaginis TaxID=178769 RepID=UPI0035315991